MFTYMVAVVKQVHNMAVTIKRVVYVNKNAKFYSLLDLWEYVDECKSFY